MDQMHYPSIQYLNLLVEKWGLLLTAPRTTGNIMKTSEMFWILLIAMLLIEIDFAEE